MTPDKERDRLVRRLEKQCSGLVMASKQGLRTDVFLYNIKNTVRDIENASTDRFFRAEPNVPTARVIDLFTKKG